MSFIRKIKRGEKIYYAEVENRWINGKCVQKHIRSLGTDPDRPTNLPIEPVHFSYLAVRLMQGDLTPNEVFDMLEGMGHPVTRDSLERIGINYDFGKKTFCIYLFYPKNSKNPPPMPHL
ncbi:MAG: hypothetical protein C5S38_00820 [Candidatus Methanophagaceae archaeon]|nr:MAG: hypothetical protein C5S38_00820 [Methanophagales archaeon]KAF5431454.1 hypothetical protein C5S36_10540 [Methanophagales archaeon]